MNWINRTSEELNNSLTDEQIIIQLKEDIKLAKRKAKVIGDLGSQLSTEFDELETKRKDACKHLVWYHQKEKEKEETCDDEGTLQIMGDILL